MPGERIPRQIEDIITDVTLFKDGSQVYEDIKTKKPWADVRAFGARGDGVTDDTTAIQSAANSLTGGGILFFPKPSLYYKVSTTINIGTADYTMLLSGKGAEIKISVSGTDLLNITKDHCDVIGITLEGEGTYVTSGSSGANLIKSTGDYTTIRNCYLKEPEQIGIKIVSGNYANIEYNTIIGGPYFDSATGGSYPMGDDREHYGIRLESASYWKVNFNTIKPNSKGNAGVCITGIYTSYTSIGAEVKSNVLRNCWDQSIYLPYFSSSVISHNRAFGCGYKVGMEGGRVDGFTCTDNIVDIGGLVGWRKPGQAGFIFASVVNCNISNNKVYNALDEGFIFHSKYDTDPIAHNTITNNVIDKVYSAGVAYGIKIYGTNIFKENNIEGNIIVNIGSGEGEPGHGIHIFPNNTDDHIGNRICGNVIANCQEAGIRALYLTHCDLSNNIIRNIGIGTISSAFYITDFQRCKITNNAIYGVGTQMNYGYREADSDYNWIKNNLIYNATTEMIRTSGFGANSIAQENWDGV